MLQRATWRLGYGVLKVSRSSPVGQWCTSANQWDFIIQHKLIRSLFFLYFLLFLQFSAQCTIWSVPWTLQTKPNQRELLPYAADGCIAWLTAAGAISSIERKSPRTATRAQCPGVLFYFVSTRGWPPHCGRRSKGKHVFIFTSRHSGKQRYLYVSFAINMLRKR